MIRNGWLGENLGVWHRETPAKVGPLYDLYSAIAAITSEMKEIPMAIHARALAGLLSRRRISRIPVMQSSESGLRPAIQRLSSSSDMSLGFVNTRSLPQKAPPKRGARDSV